MLLRYVAVVSLIALVGMCVAAADYEAEMDEETLRAARLRADGPSLLAVFRKRTPDADSQARIKALIARLGSDSFSEREAASEKLAEHGFEAAGLLRKATRYADLEIRWRARDALSVIEQNEYSADVLIAALRVLGRLKPPRLADALLNYVPHAADADVIEAVSGTLAAAALHDGEAEPALVRALESESSIQRGIAGAALCMGGCRKQLPAVRRLLRDSDPQVRCRVGLALLGARDKAAVPVLIELLTLLPIGEAERIEAMLLQIAGDASPNGTLDEDGPHVKYRDAWAAWWKANGDGLDLTKIELSSQWRGYTLAVCFGIGGRARGRTGTIVKYDARGRTRWQLQGLVYPVDAQVLDERRVLVTEYNACQVTERNRNGDILRRIQVPESPLEARRLSNGNTLITTSSRVFEVDRKDKEVWTMNSNGRGAIAAACPLPGGHVGICYGNGEFVRLDRHGKPITSFRVGRLFRPIATHIQGLPNGHVLVPQYYDNKVVEYDEEGREVWSASYARPTSAQRLPNGRTLVAGYAGNVIVELDKDGREVKQLQCNGRLMCVRGR